MSYDITILSTNGSSDPYFLENELVMEIEVGENIIGSSINVPDPELVLNLLLTEELIHNAAYSVFIKPETADEDYPNSQILFGDIDYDFLRQFEGM